MKKSVLNKIVKTCGTPEHFTFEYINGASTESDIRRMKEYVKCVNKITQVTKKR